MNLGRVLDRSKEEQKVAEKQKGPLETSWRCKESPSKGRRRRMVFTYNPGQLGRKALHTPARQLSQDIATTSGRGDNKGEKEEHIHTDTKRNTTQNKTTEKLKPKSIKKKKGKKSEKAKKTTKNQTKRRNQTQKPTNPKLPKKSI